MTANTTPRSGLIQPGNSDYFDPADFATSFGIIDNMPGFKLVANYGSLPTNLTVAQHGSPYLQLDNGAAWFWYQPSNAPGSFKRFNSLGLLSSVQAAGNISTTATTAVSAPTVASTTITAPGGRSIEVYAHAGCTNLTSLSHGSILSLWVNNVMVKEAQTTGSQYGVSDEAVIRHVIVNPTPGQSIPIRITPRTFSGSGGGGTVTAYAASTGIIVSEL